MKPFSTVLFFQLLFLIGVVTAFSYIDDTFDLSRRDAEATLEDFYARQDVLKSLSTRHLVEELEDRLSRRGPGDYGNPALDLAKDLGGVGIKKMAKKIHGHKHPDHSAGGLGDSLEDAALAARSLRSELGRAALRKIKNAASRLGMSSGSGGSHMPPASAAAGSFDGQGDDMGDGGTM